MVSALSEIKETEVADNEVTKSLCNEESKVESLATETKLSSSEQPGTEAKRFIRKASNPAFIDAQSKFEDLSSAYVPLRSRSTAFADSAISTAPGVQIGGSECGTELSISSTLDSPDGSEAGITELQHETKVPYETSETKPSLDLKPHILAKSPPSPRKGKARLSVPENLIRNQETTTTVAAVTSYQVTSSH